MKGVAEDWAERSPISLENLGYQAAVKKEDPSVEDYIRRPLLPKRYKIGKTKKYDESCRLNMACAGSVANLIVRFPMWTRSRNFE